MKWVSHAKRLADEIVRRESTWHSAVAEVPRHEFVSRWWEPTGDGIWILRDGPSDREAWLQAAYTDQTLVTRVDACHADRPGAEDVGIAIDGTPTSSSTLPSLVVGMYRHAMIADDCMVLVTTGTGYRTALACARLGDAKVTSIDVDADLVNMAKDRLALYGYRPQTAVCDITQELPGTYDRIVATVSVRPVPVSWLAALRPGGRLVTTIAGTGLILTADKTKYGATGRIEWDRAGFMPTRDGDDYGHQTDDVWKEAKDAEGEEVITSRYPLLYPPDAWDVMSMLELYEPGVVYRRDENGDERTVWLLHPDGSWARATAPGFLDCPARWPPSPLLLRAGPARTPEGIGYRTGGPGGKRNPELAYCGLLSGAGQGPSGTGPVAAVGRTCGGRPSPRWPAPHPSSWSSPDSWAAWRTIPARPLPQSGPPWCGPSSCAEARPDGG